jgi:UDP-galactose transporter
MVLSSILFLLESGPKSAADQIKDSLCHNWRDSFKLAIPGFLYSCHGFLTFFAMGNLSVATFQILFQTRILTTGLFSMVLLDKKLAKQQWAALVVLMLGAVTAEYSHPDGLANGFLSNANKTASEAKSDHFQGVVALVPAIFLSSFSTVFVEKVLKTDSSISMWLRNVQLAIATFCPLVVLAMLIDGESLAKNGLLHGYTDALAWSLPLSHGIGGLLVSCVIKYANSVIVAFLASAGILAGLLVDWFVFQANLGLPFVGSALLVGVAVVLYNKYKGQ